MLVGDDVGISAQFKFAVKGFFSSIFLVGLLARKKLSAHFVLECSLTIFVAAGI